MPLYRFADVTVRLASLSPFAAQFLNDYRVDAAAVDEDLTLSDRDLAEEAALTPHASAQMLEITAILRKLADALPRRYDGLMLHAATVVYNGKAYAFVAPSGTGKTTHCRLWVDVLGDNAFILNGDKLLLRRRENGFFAYGNPWRGKEGYGTNGCYTLGGICLLHRASQNTIENADTTDALAALLHAVPLPKSSDARLATLQMLERLLDSVPVRTLHVNRDPDAVYTALRGLEDTP